MVIAVVALSLFGLMRTDVKVDRYRSGPWTVEVKQDSFTGGKHCSASRASSVFGPETVFDHGVVTFYFSGGADTANAQFRVDGGDLRKASSVVIEAAGLGAGYQTNNFENPSNGEVHIPLSVVGDARAVEIKPNDKAPPRSFRLDGLTAAVSSMQSRGCVVG